jgi:hypothetical protein
VKNEGCCWNIIDGIGYRISIVHAQGLPYVMSCHVLSSKAYYRNALGRFGLALATMSNGRPDFVYYTPLDISRRNLMNVLLSNVSLSQMRQNIRVPLKILPPEVSPISRFGRKQRSHRFPKVEDIPL